MYREYLSGGRVLDTKSNSQTNLTMRTLFVHTVIQNERTNKTPCREVFRGQASSIITPSAFATLQVARTDTYMASLSLLSCQGSEIFIAVSSYLQLVNFHLKLFLLPRARLGSSALLSAAFSLISLSQYGLHGAVSARRGTELIFH